VVARQQCAYPASIPFPSSVSAASGLGRDDLQVHFTDRTVRLRILLGRYDLDVPRRREAPPAEVPGRVPLERG
jgi:hypothetical protein